MPELLAVCIIFITIWFYSFFKKIGENMRESERKYKTPVDFKHDFKKKKEDK